MNRIYLIQYDVADDSVIVNRIKSLGNWIQYFEKNWIVKTNLAPKAIYEKLSLDYEKDRFFIIELSSTNYWGRMDTTVWDWFSQNK